MTFRSEQSFDEIVLDEALEEVALLSQTSEPLTGKDLEDIILEHREKARKIAHSLLRRWRVALPLEEIESIVDLTLCEAANRFSPTQGATFITFFFYYMRGNLARNIGKLARISRLFVVPGNSLDMVSYLASSRNQENSNEINNFYPSNVETSLPESLLLRHERTSICNRALACLDPVDREVLLRLYDDDESLVDIAKKLGYSRCHVSRIKKRALAQLRNNIGALSEDYCPRSDRRERATSRVIEYPTVAQKRRGRHRRNLPTTLITKHRFTNAVVAA